MTKRRMLLALAVMLMLVIGGAVQPLIERARANTPQSAGGPTNAVPNPQQWGPVDQSKPLDFSDQPASVPRTYVPGRVYNVQKLHKKDYAYVVGQMALYTQALGVQCTYCHNVQNFAYDTHVKKIARQMIGMTQNVNATWIDTTKGKYPQFAVSGAVGCVTCHRGNPVNPVALNVIPVQYLDWPAKNTRQAGVVANSMYNVSRSLGVNCLFCHNSADFISLQYYPTNRIAHRMWQMVDDINHRWLSSEIPAVTCYSCHQGAKYPNALVTSSDDQTPADVVPAHPDAHKNPGAYTDTAMKGT